MSDLFKNDDENKRLLAHSTAITNKLMVNFNRDLSDLKNHVLVTNKEMKSEIQMVTKDVQKMKEAEGYLEAKCLCKLIGYPTDTATTGQVGKQLTKLSFRLNCPKRYRDDPTYDKIGLYHPYVCKIFLEQNNIIVPPRLQYAIK